MAPSAQPTRRFALHGLQAQPILILWRGDCLSEARPDLSDVAPVPATAAHLIQPRRRAPISQRQRAVASLRLGTIRRNTQQLQHGRFRLFAAVPATTPSTVPGRPDPREFQTRPARAGPRVRDETPRHGMQESHRLSFKRGYRWLSVVISIAPRSTVRVLVCTSIQDSRLRVMRRCVLTLQPPDCAIRGCRRRAVSSDCRPCGPLTGLAANDIGIHAGLSVRDTCC